MTVGVEGIIEVASAALGPCRFVADLSWPHGESVVAELEATSGQRVIGKSHRQPEKYAAERFAYEHWVPVLGDRAPALITADDDAEVLVITKVDAHAIDADADLVDVHRQAGALLARFHRAAAPTTMTGYAQDRKRRLDQWVERAAPGVLSEHEIGFAALQLDELDHLPDPIGVASHRDWQPRNWLVDDAHRLIAIDFEHARIGPWFEDIQRLRWNEWVERPELAVAFFDGYGRWPNEVEARTLMATSIFGHITTIVWSHEHHDEDFAEFGRKCLVKAEQMVRRPVDQWWPT